MEEYINKLRESNIFASIDLQLAKFIGRIDDNTIILFSAALLSRKMMDGHICLPLHDFAGKILVIDDNIFEDVPNYEEWLKVLQDSPAVGVPGEYKPFILDDNKIYLQKYWFYEKKIADKLKKMASVSYDFDKEKERQIKKQFNSLFANIKDDDQDKVAADEKTSWQKTAAIMALSQKFCVISGGPGTGKTTTLAKVLCILLKDNHELKIALAAPTGKAAARMNESIVNAVGELNFDLDILDILTKSKAVTLHRLLGSIINSVKFKHNKENPLPHDIVIIDEASMVDITMMAKLLDSLKEETRLILLGDKNQLSSVEAGSVLGDICSTTLENKFSQKFFRRCNNIIENEEEKLNKQRNLTTSADSSVFSDCIVQFMRSYRFKSWEGVGKLSRYINSPDEDKTGIFEIIDDPKLKEHICFNELPSLKNNIPEDFKQKIVSGYRSYIFAATPEEALQKFGDFRILSSLRKGEYGIVNINRVVEGILKEKVKGFYPTPTSYHNKPIMITRNDAAINLFNGDVGIIRKGKTGLKAYFPSPEKGGKAREISLNLLPEHETVFAMTIHKSQGSEFKRILIITPDRINPVLTRELIYTGITRTKKVAEIMGVKEVFMEAVCRKTERYSGLTDRLNNL